uniref:AMP-dependent synthetase/ligase domain-containing protein n=1 Tax=Strombidium rassoulzadegani TaxID=1082188 RepID=A0A7S3FX02_9SPIT|mmetsp:Transcript_5427/g.9137  ORF Transcript_5427/g.9137 Transcript_5427/m.9137 type:complete len:575 (+) Transcript_5427:354-2078(+)
MEDEKEWRFLGIQSKNRKEWVLSYLGAMHQSTTVVALYDTLGHQGIKYIINQTKVETFSVAAEQVVNLVKLKIEDSQNDNMMESFKNLIIFEKNRLSEDEMKIVEESGLKIHYLDDLILLGSQIEARGTGEDKKPSIDDCLMLSYTSGTTGDPKGVILTHKMILNAADATMHALQPNFVMAEKDCYISYLPAAHSYEQLSIGASLLSGMKCGFYSGNILKLTEDLQVLKPTVFSSVPRLYNRIYGKIQDKMKTSTGLAKFLLNTAVNSKMSNFEKDGSLTHFFWDKVVFKKIKALLGGNIQLMSVGSAPISPDVINFIKVCFSAEVIEGYGMTETSAGSVTSMFGELRRVQGGPVRNVKVKLRDIPEMGYLSSNDPPRGELCMYGSSIMPGYFRNPEKTAEAIKDGWIMSGDVAEIQQDGSIKIIDRAKNIFKLSQAEYIAPEKLENVYTQSKYILQAFIYGDSLKDYVIGFFVPDPDTLAACAKEKEVANPEDLLDNQEFIQTVYDDLMVLAAQNKFTSLEKPKQILLLKEQFTIENDMLTPTQKLKRNIARDKYKDKIDELYGKPIMKQTGK